MFWIVRLARPIVVASLITVLSTPGAAAQGVTTAAVRGRVTDQSGAPIEGASVVLTNTSTGQRFRTTSRVQGFYGIENAAVGGPYTLEARLIGHRPATRTGITLSLGQVFEADLRLERAAVELEGVTVVAEEGDRVMSPEVQGTRLTVSDSILRRLPTLDREFQDFVRLMPQVAVRDGDEGGLTAAGQNNRYNTIQIDGSTVNDRFGLGRTGLTGGQAGGRAVGLEAVKEYQVLLAPYDVRQGNFTGALINAVTKSGTNAWHGTGFYYFRNQNLAGEPLSNTDFSQHQFGASLGGPIRRDLAHFFLNAEFKRRARPASGPFIGQTGAIRVTQAQVDAFNAALDAYGLPGTGTGGLITNENPLGNFLGRIDYRVGNSSRLVLRYIYNSAEEDIFSRANSGTFDLSTVGYFFNNRTHNPSIQFFTNFGNGMSNELLFSLNRIRDKRTPTVVTPLIIVQNFPAANATAPFALQSGSERFSQGNELDQDIWEITDNLTIPVKNHRITIGTRNEFYKVRNLFAQSSYGVWTFDNLTDFQTGTAEQYESAGDLGAGIAATFNAGLFGVYAQDQWEVSPQLTVTAGLRVDVPTFFDKPSYDPRVAADGFNTDLPSGQLMFAPRIGFNWDLGERTTQVRGGIGLFTGAPAYVWYSNAYSNNGTKIGRITCTATIGGVPAFSTTLGGPLQCADGSGLSTTTIGEVNTVGADTKFPQVLRGNLAIDRRLPAGIVATAELMFTKGVNDFLIVNRNLVEPASTNRDVNGRLMYGTINANGTVAPNYVDVTLYGPSFNGGVYELLNTSNNSSVTVTGQLQKRFADGWEATLGYTYSNSKDVQSFTSSRAISNWRFGRPYSGSQLEDNATTSAFARPHRLVAGVTYSAPWTQYPTDISLSYVVQSGQSYTLIAGGASGRGDLNADGNQNDPIYVPRNSSEITFVDIGARTAAVQAAAFDQYLEGEECLLRQRGRVMQRNSCRSPSQQFLNLTVRQSLPQVGRGHLSLEVGVFNLLNVLNKDWGQIRTPNGIIFNEYSILNMVDAPGGVPRYQLNFNPATQARFMETSSFANAYQIQVALRYGF
jgi:hypothetical protein